MGYGRGDIYRERDEDNRAEIARLRDQKRDLITIIMNLKTYMTQEAQNVADEAIIRNTR